MRMGRIAAAALAAVAMGSANAALTEGFDSVDALAAAGWLMTNNSVPVGSDWFQGNEGAFSSQAGAANSYVGANFLSTTATQGVVDNWLISPVLALTSGTTLSFFARTADAGFSDALQVLFTSGSSSATSSFTSLLLNVGTLSSTGWTKYSVALPNVASGRFAFRYLVADAMNADYIGIDTVNVAAVPEPATLALFGLGLAAISVVRRRSSLS